MRKPKDDFVLPRDLRPKDVLFLETKDGLDYTVRLMYRDEAKDNYYHVSWTVNRFASAVDGTRFGHEPLFLLPEGTTVPAWDQDDAYKPNADPCGELKAFRAGCRLAIRLPNGTIHESAPVNYLRWNRRELGGIRRRDAIDELARIPLNVITAMVCAAAGPTIAYIRHDARGYAAAAALAAIALATVIHVIRLYVKYGWARR